MAFDMFKGNYILTMLGIFTLAWLIRALYDGNVGESIGVIILLYIIWHFMHKKEPKKKR